MKYIIPNMNDTETAEIKIPTQIMAKARQTAEENGLSFSELITYLLVQALEEPQEEPKAEYYSAQDSADILGITIVTLYNWIKNKKIDAFKVGGKWCISKETIDKMTSGVESYRIK